jgi:hypothetical protein
VPGWREIVPVCLDWRTQQSCRTPLVFRSGIDDLETHISGGRCALMKT